MGGLILGSHDRLGRNSWAAVLTLSCCLIVKFNKKNKNVKKEPGCLIISIISVLDGAGLLMFYLGLNNTRTLKD